MGSQRQLVVPVAGQDGGHPIFGEGAVDFGLALPEDRRSEAQQCA